LEATLKSLKQVPKFVFVSSLDWQGDNHDVSHTEQIAVSLGATIVKGEWSDESPYGYVNGRATWGADPSGLLLTAKAGKCRVYKCYANRLLGHGCLVVEGPNLGCSSSRDPDSQYECGGAPGNRVDWDCRLISTDCEYGAKVCECVRLNKGGRPLLEYCKHGGCKQYITNLACCGCHRLPANKRGACEKKECAPAYWSEPPHRGGYGCGGGGGGLSLPKI
jgi:hypothetical protein